MSQNIGHENIGTTLTTYGRLDQYRVGEVISRLDFADSTHSCDDPEVKAAIELIMRKSKRNS